MIDITGHHYARLMDVQIEGAERSTAIRMDSPQAWLERVVTDGSLDLPADRRLLRTGPTALRVAGRTGLVLAEHCRFTSP
jgi:hypothetical protein